MKNHKRTPRPKRQNITAHRRAMTDPEIHKLALDLRRQWNRLDRVERGDRLRELASRGCSTRGLVEILGVSDRTICRHMEIARLSESERASISNGRSAKKILNKKAFEKRQLRTAERLEYERSTGLLSDQVADVILAFCAAGEKHPQTPMLAVDFPKFLPRVSAHVVTLDLWNTPPLRISKKAGLVGLFKRLRPREKKDVLWVEHHAEWLAKVMRNIAPERSILVAGLEKAENRSSELERKNDKKTPEQLYWQRAERLTWLSFGPPVHRPKRVGKLAPQRRKSRT